MMKQCFNPKRSLGRSMSYFITACSLLLFIRPLLLVLIRNSPLLLIKRQTKSALLKNKIQASPNGRFGFNLNGVLSRLELMRLMR